MGGGIHIKINKFEDAQMELYAGLKHDTNKGMNANSFSFGTNPIYHSTTNQNYHNWRDPMPKYKSVCTAWNPTQLLTNPNFIGSGGASCSGWTLSGGIDDPVQGLKVDKNLRIPSNPVNSSGNNYTRYMSQTGVMSSGNGNVYALFYDGGWEGPNRYAWAVVDDASKQVDAYTTTLTNSGTFQSEQMLPSYCMTHISGVTDLNLYQYYYNNNLYMKSVKLYDAKELTAGFQTFHMKYGDTEAACNAASYKTYQFGMPCTIDGTGKGNGHKDFNSATSETITPRYVKIKLTFYRDHPWAMSKGIYDLKEK